MSLHKSIDKYLDTTKMAAAPAVDPWQFQYPNTADFNFNYWNLLNNAADSAIATNTNPNFRVAIVGAGVAGLVAARELFRSGFGNIDIYEASDRIGGRNYSIPAPNNTYTTYEMGAMRMPFFWPYDPNNTYWGPGSQNCVLDYYCTLFGISTQNFPDPGSAVIADTGIYMNNGLGPDPDNPYSQPTLQIWNTQNGSVMTPPSLILSEIYTLWSNFATMVTTASQAVYGTPQWESFWQGVVSTYWQINFRELVYMPAIQSYNPADTGFFGGLGMNDTQAWDFYVIGAGDGGWGAFFDISALYPIRTLLFGFADHHQLIQGLFTNGTYKPGPQPPNPVDSLGNPLIVPNYLGLQSMAECLFYEPSIGNGGQQLPSLYEATQAKSGVNLYTQNPAAAIQQSGPNQITIVSPGVSEPQVYDAVIVTPTTWALEMNSVFQGFDYSTLPYEVSLSMKESHWITSCKVFFPLTQRYWEQPNPNGGDQIPQVINTDTFLQDVYGIAVSVGDVNDPGVLLASYTWEDDASKLEASDDASLAAQCLAELDNILMSCTNIKMKISPFVDATQPVIIHWERQPTYRGCAKLYRERSWNLDYALLRYNSQYSASSGIYFAGEGYSVEGGWTEPALRLALDAVINLVQNTGGQFNNGFSYSDYPQYSSWNPS